MIVPVHMLANYGKGTVRNVDIPDDEVADQFGAYDPDETQRVLEHAFRYGQNDFQPQKMYSVSVGDVIELNGEYWEVAPMGFEKLIKEEFDELDGERSRDPDFIAKMFQDHEQ